MSAARDASGVGPAGEQMALTDTPGQLGPAVAGLGLGILAGSLARSRSESYGEQESSALRATAHATVPFFVAASALADRAGASAAVPLRGAFLLRYRRPVPIYASLVTLLASGLAFRKRSR
jgi:hypothetical protein